MKLLLAVLLFCACGCSTILRPPVADGGRTASFVPIEFHMISTEAISTSDFGKAIKATRISLEAKESTTIGQLAILLFPNERGRCFMTPYPSLAIVTYPKTSIRQDMGDKRLRELAIVASGFKAGATAYLSKNDTASLVRVCNVILHTPPSEANGPKTDHITECIIVFDFGKKTIVAFHIANE